MRRLLCLVLLLAGASVAVAQPSAGISPERRKALLEGTHAFRRMLFDRKLEAIKDFDALAESPKQSILVVLGKLDRLEELPGGLGKFVRNGGAVLLASDEKLPDGAVGKEVRAITGVSINEERVRCVNAAGCYASLDFCPYLVEPNPAPSQLFKGIGIVNSFARPVATNIPSYLIRRARNTGSVKPVAYLPFNSWTIPTADRHSRHIDDNEGYPLFAVAGPVDSGKILVLADHSLFINQMMMLAATETNNKEFTDNVLTWLIDGDPPRDRVMLLEGGVVSTDFEIPLKSANVPLAEALELLFRNRQALTRKANEVMHDFEAANRHNEIAERALDEAGMPLSRLARISFLVVTGVLVLVAAYRLASGARFRRDTAPTLTRLLADNLADRPLAVQRPAALAEGKALLDPARHMIRRWFSLAGLDPTPGSDLPALAFSVGWWNRRSLTARLTRLWRLATGARAERLTPPQLWKLQRELDALQADRERGLWKPAVRGS